MHEQAAGTFHEDLVLGHALEQLVVLGVVLADSLCRGTGQSHEQLLGCAAGLHRTSPNNTTTTTTTSISTSAGTSAAPAGHSRYPVPQRPRALHQAQHVGPVHVGTLAHIEGLEHPAARHTLHPAPAATTPPRPR